MGSRAKVEKKDVVIELRIKMLREVPTDWDQRMIGFFFNESSHCIANEIDELKQWNDDASEYSCCDSCGRTEVVFLRDASAADLENLPPQKEKIEEQ
tara:strand:+ start:360 stop:650 length:291 start_codon:yes stop_codon:yes gene_type:complete